MRATKLLPAIMLLFVSFTASAQEYNPFKSIGKKGKILTLSKGKYVEVFDYDTIQRIGTVLINIRTKKIVKLLNAEATFKKFSDNSSASRWYSPDPLADQFASLSPYNFVENNPINMIDPDGRAASPIYDENGKFLGTDDQGFKGEVLFQSKALYDFLTLGGNITQTHQGAVAMSSTIDQALSNDPTQQNIDMVTNAINDVVSKTDDKGFNMSDLKNGKVSSYYAGANSKGDLDTYANNGGTPVSNVVPGQTSPKADANGQKTMTFNVGPTSLIARTTNGVVQGTVENIQNVAVHEGKGHITNKVPGDGVKHAQAYQLQMNHPTYKNTTTDFKTAVYEAYKLVKAGKL